MTEVDRVLADSLPLTAAPPWRVRPPFHLRNPLSFPRLVAIDERKPPPVATVR
jgi:hypothetical protein